MECLSIWMLILCRTNIKLGQSTCFPLEENGSNGDPRHLRQDHPFPRHARDRSQSEIPIVRSCYLWPFDAVAGLLLKWPRAGERPRLMSWHDSNTIIRPWHRASLSEGERAERRVTREARETRRDRQTHVGRQRNRRGSCTPLMDNDTHTQMNTQ